MRLPPLVCISPYPPQTLTRCHLHLPLSGHLDLKADPQQLLEPSVLILAPKSSYLLTQHQKQLHIKLYVKAVIILNRHVLSHNLQKQGLGLHQSLLSRHQQLAYPKANPLHAYPSIQEIASCSRTGRMLRSLRVQGRQFHREE